MLYSVPAIYISIRRRCQYDRYYIHGGTEGWRAGGLAYGGVLVDEMGGNDAHVCL